MTLTFALSCLAMSSIQAQKLRTEDLHIRDPFVLVDQKQGVYYMYRSASTQASPGVPARGGVEVFKSTQLKEWEGPIKVLSLPDGNWATGGIWAPEVHRYKNKYYLFATVNTPLEWKRDKKYRGTQIFWSKSPEGPFKPFGRFPYTPLEQMALDGTLWVEDGQPYMVYCHEWVQVDDGEMMVRRLKKDLSAPVGEPVRLFCASAAPWVTFEGMAVTDGPFLYKTKTGKLLMLWSSFKEGRYAIGISESVTGSVFGPWKHQPEPLFSQDGGHGMLFRDLEGHLMLTIHAPNSVNERAHFYELEDTGDTLVMKE